MEIESLSLFIPIFSQVENEIFFQVYNVINKISVNQITIIYVINKIHIN